MVEDITYHSNNTLLRIFKRKNTHRALTLKKMDGLLFFAERRRGYVQQGPLLILIDDPDPITEFNDDVQYLLPLTMRVKRGEDITAKRLKHRDDDKKRREKIAAVASEEFSSELRWMLQKRY